MQQLERLRIIRKNANLSQEEFAHSLGLKQGSYSDIERGKTKGISETILKLLSRTYQINKDWLLTGEGEMFDVSSEDENTAPIAIDRLIEFINYLKDNKRGGRTNFERTIGVSGGYITNSLKKKASIGADIMLKINTTYPELNSDWLISGEGDMLKSSRTIDKPHYESLAYTSKPFIDSIYATLGVPNGFALAVKSDECEQISIPFVSDYDFSIRGRGDSMINRANPSKSINEGDVIACKLWLSRTHIRWGEVYCLATSDGVVVKKVMPAEKEGHIRCISHNEEDGYKPYEIPLNEIHDWALVVSVIRISNW